MPQRDKAEIEMQGSDSRLHLGDQGLPIRDGEKQYMYAFSLY
jgi:hypothetical protein